MIGVNVYTEYGVSEFCVKCMVNRLWGKLTSIKTCIMKALKLAKMRPVFVTENKRVVKLKRS